MWFWNLLSSSTLVIGITAGAHAQNNLTGQNISKAETGLAEIVESAARESKAGAILDVQGCGISFREARGIANRKTKAPMPITEQLRLGSIGKLYTAAIIHQLVHNGQLTLDAPIENYLSAEMNGVPNATATLRQLLNHTSGIPDYYDWQSYIFWDWTKPITSERVLKVARRRKATSAPGEKYSYSNTNYHLLAMAAEKVSGKSLGELIKTYILTPLKLNETRYHTSHPGGTIHGYGTELRSWADTWKYAENTGPDSGITASANDLTRFMRETFLEDGALRKLGKDMQGSRVPADSPRRADGAGAEFYIGRNGHELVGHTGDTFGYLSFAFAIADYQATIVAHISANKKEVFTNTLTQTVDVLKETCITSK